VNEQEKKQITDAIAFLARGFRAEAVGGDGRFESIWLEAARRTERTLGGLLDSLKADQPAATETARPAWEQDTTRRLREERDHYRDKKREAEQALASALDDVEQLKAAGRAAAARIRADAADALDVARRAEPQGAPPQDHVCGLVSAALCCCSTCRACEAKGAPPKLCPAGAGPFDNAHVCALPYAHDGDCDFTRVRAKGAPQKPEGCHHEPPDDFLGCPECDPPR
jgi:hypothetical protein